MAYIWNDEIIEDVVILAKKDFLNIGIIKWINLNGLKIKLSGMIEEFRVQSYLYILILTI